MHHVVVLLHVYISVRYDIGEGQQHYARYLSVSSGNIILYRYVLMVRANTMLLDILVFLLTILYCTGMY